MSHGYYVAQPQRFDKKREEIRRRWDKLVFSTYVLAAGVSASIECTARPRLSRANRTIHSLCVVLGYGNLPERGDCRGDFGRFQTTLVVASRRPGRCCLEYSRAL